jgi:iron complex outermembrane receptor protein
MRGSSTTLLLTLLFGPPLQAQQRPDSLRIDSIPPRLVELVVEAQAPLHHVGTDRPFRLKITSLSLPAAPSLDQVLRTLPMLHVRRNSRGETELSVRGSDSRQVAVLLDGIPLTLGWDGRVDASVIPAGAVHEVQFTRGLASMLYGPNVLGGIVELSVGHSSQMPERASSQLVFGGNHTGGFGGTITGSAPFGSPQGRWLVRAGAEYSDSPGHPLASGIEEPLPADHGLRVNTDARSISGFASLRYQSNQGPWVSLAGSAFNAERGIAAELGSENPRFWRYPQVSRGLAVLSGGTGHHRALFGGIGDLEASVGLDLGRTEIDAYTDRTYSETSGFENGNDRTLTARLIGDHTLGSRADLRAAFTLARIAHHEFLPDGEARYRQHLVSIGSESVVRLIENGDGRESLRLTAGAAYDGGSTPESGGREPLGTLGEWGGRVGVSAVLGGGATLLHAGISRRARFPSLRELYSGALNRFAPNPALRPEKLVAAEAGITTRIGQAEFHVVGFRNRMRDAVVRITLPDRRFMRVNRDRLDSYGVELLASTVLGTATIGADLTAQHARITATDSGEERQPENLPSFFGAIYGRTPIALGITAAAEARFTGRQFCIDPGTGLDRRLDGGVIANGELVRPWRLRGSAGGLFTALETRLSVQNAGNRALYDQCGLPEPGRVISFQIRVF